MHIKRIVIQGFKTYKNTTIIDDLSPHHNLVLGGNGSGKSNFFAAIRFVLSDKYTNMSREERQALIHEGIGTVMSAYVEIVFDNTDRRFPINKDEIVIRRTIGMKKDDYSLDQKSATKSDITNLLESAGFSKSNPYYIVPQGRIADITNFKDSGRLQLLKEVAGAKVFEAKLKESLKEMSNTNTKRDQIDDVLKYIQTRLDDLNLEKDDLKEFDRYNSKKKAIEYNLFDRELVKLNESLELLEANHRTAAEESDHLNTQLAESEKRLLKINEKIEDISSTKKLVQIDIDENTAIIEDILSKIGKTEITLKSLESAHEASNTEYNNNKEILQEVLTAIQVKEASLNKLTPKIKQFKEKEIQLKNVLSTKTTDHRLLLSKRGRSSQFDSQSSRDAWLTEQIKGIEGSIENKELSLKELTKANEKLALSLASTDKEIQEIDNTETKEISKEIQQLEAQHATARQQYNKLIDERKSMWREQGKLNSVISTYNQEKSKVEEQVSESMSRSMALGLESVARIAKRLDLTTGVYGPLGELIDVSEKYKTAIDVVGGSSLFHVVVDNDKTASIIMEELTREKSGRVTFMPLNRLKNSDITYPERRDCVPLIKKIAYEDHLLPAVKQVFGKTVVCVDLEVGEEISKTNKLNAITVEGDTFDRRGILTGGFREQKKSKVDCLKELRKWKTEIIDTENRLLQIDQNIALKDQEINKTNESMNSIKAQIDTLRSQNSQALQEVLRLNNLRSSIENEITSVNNRISTTTGSLNSLKTQLSRYQSELETPFEEGLTSEESEAIRSLHDEIPQIQQQYNRVVERLGELELEASSLSATLNENLYHKKDQLESLVESEKSELLFSANTEITEVKRQLEYLSTSKQNSEAQNEKLTKKIEVLNNEIKKLDQEREKLDEIQLANLGKIGKLTKSSEKYFDKRLTLTTRRDAINGRIRELGVLPDEAFTSYKSSEYSSNDLLEKLREVNEELKQYAHVNRKALEQFVNFTKQRDSLVERREELTSAKASIENLISILEKRKDEAINRTFKSVSIGFKKIFEQLVPAGKGELTIIKGVTNGTSSTQSAASTDNSISIDSMDQDPNGNSDQSESTENYIGVSLSVSFNSKEDEQQHIEQLSGGQKSLCALALILAIQRCDPAPFYIFDEVDANLDTQYRTAIAKLINELSKGNAQFICTTFKPEMVQVADKFYGVTYENKVSTISAIDRNYALSFVEGLRRADGDGDN